MIELLKGSRSSQQLPVPAPKELAKAVLTAVQELAARQAKAALRLRRRIAARPRRPEPRSNRVAGSGTAASLIAIGLHEAAAALP